MPTARQKILSTSWNVQVMAFNTSEKLNNNSEMSAEWKVRFAICIASVAIQAFTKLLFSFSDVLKAITCTFQEVDNIFCLAVQQHPELCKIFKEPHAPILAFGKSKSLKDILVRADISPQSAYNDQCKNDI
jgi:CTP synthase (UTP-ammonia lyase)